MEIPSEGIVSLVVCHDMVVETRGVWEVRERKRNEGLWKRVFKKRKSKHECLSTAEEGTEVAARHPRDTHRHVLRSLVKTMMRIDGL